MLLEVCFSCTVSFDEGVLFQITKSLLLVPSFVVVDEPYQVARILGEVKCRKSHRRLAGRRGPSRAPGCKLSRRLSKFGGLAFHVGVHFLVEVGQEVSSLHGVFAKEVLALQFLLLLVEDGVLQVIVEAFFLVISLELSLVLLQFFVILGSSLLLGPSLATVQEVLQLTPGLVVVLGDALGRSIAFSVLVSLYLSLHPLHAVELDDSRASQSAALVVFGLLSWLDGTSRDHVDSLFDVSRLLHSPHLC